MRLSCMENDMSPLRQRKPESKRAWLSGLAIILTTLICLLGFWRLSPGITFVIASVAFLGLVAALWLAGKEAD